MMHTTRANLSRSPLAALLVLVTGLALGMAGCYRHVVEVRGPGAAAYDVYEPHYKPEEEQQIEDWFGSIFGKKPTDSKKR